VPEDEARDSVGQAVLTTTGVDNDLVGRRWRFYLYCRQQGLWPQEVTGHHPLQEPDWFAAYCPVQNVTPDYPPTLLLHGDQDTDVPYKQSVLMAAALQSQGVEHDLLTVPGGPHGFDHAGMSDPQVAQAFDRVIAFLDQHTKDN
jgi:dipeptidyl aminopeptidase/acylaminoacyl peptidase